MCSVSHNSRALNEVIYANRFKEEIRILKTAAGRYEGLQRKQFHVEHNTRAPYNSSVSFRLRKQFKAHNRDAEDELEEEQNMIPVRRMHRRSVSDSNYDHYYMMDNKEEHDGSVGPGSSNQTESVPHDNLGVLNYLEDDRIESNDSEVHVEKKLDFFMGGRDITSDRTHNERSDAPAVNPVLTKNVSAPPGIRVESMNSMFNGDIGRSIMTSRIEHYQRKCSALQTRCDKQFQTFERIPCSYSATPRHSSPNQGCWYPWVRIRCNSGHATHHCAGQRLPGVPSRI